MLAALEQLADAAGAAALEELSYHAYSAGVWPKTLTYGTQAGQRALRMHAPRAAIEHFERAIEAAEKLGQPPDAAVLRERGQAHHSLGEFELARADYEAALAAATASGDQHLAWESLIDLNLLWSARDYAVAGEYAERALAVARELNDRSCIARSLDRVGNWHMNTGRVRQALAYQQEALAVLDSIGDRRGVADTLNLLGMTSAFVDSEQSADYYTRAIPLSREFDNRQDLVTALVMRVLASGFYYGDTFAPARVGCSSVRARRRGSDPARAVDRLASRRVVCPMGAGALVRHAGAVPARIRAGLQPDCGSQRRSSTGSGSRPDCARSERCTSTCCCPSERDPCWSAHWNWRANLARSCGLRMRQRDWRRYSRWNAILRKPPQCSRLSSRADTPMETATERQLWCARADVLLARGAAREALEVAERLAASLARWQSGAAPVDCARRRIDCVAVVRLGRTVAQGGDSGEPGGGAPIAGVAGARRIRPIAAHARAAR